MITVKCVKCGSLTAFKNNALATVSCHQCGGQEVSFDRDVIRMSGVSKTREAIKAGKVVPSYITEKNGINTALCRYKETIKSRVKSKVTSPSNNKLRTRKRKKKTEDD